MEIAGGEVSAVVGAGSAILDMKALPRSNGWIVRPVDLKTSSEKTLPLEKSKPRVDPLDEPIGDGYCLDPEETPEKMAGRDPQISGGGWKLPVERSAPWWEVGAPSYHCTFDVICRPQIYLITYHYEI